MWPGPSDFSRALVDRDDLERELGLLTIDQRAVLVLHFYLGLQLAEVAGILDVPIGTAKSRLHRGLEVLRDSMRPRRSPSTDWPRSARHEHRSSPRAAGHRRPEQGRVDP